MSARYLPAKPGPLLALSALIFVHQFDVIGFSVLLPEMRDAFGVSDTTIGAIANGVAVSGLLLAYPIGVLADRYSRRASVRIGAVVFVVAALVTSFAWTLPVFVASRFIAGLPPMANDVVQPGMLGDLYDDRDQPRVFAIWRGAATISGVSALLLGAVAAAWDWRAAFLVIALLGFVVLAPAWRVPEPPSSPRAADALEASLVEASLVEGKLVVSVDEPADADVDGATPAGLTRTRWLWVSAFLYGAASVPFTTVMSLFFDDVYGLGPFGRGVLIAIATAGTLAGLAVGAPLAERDDRRHGTAGLITALTRSLVLFAVSVLMVGTAPVLLLSVAGVIGAAMSSGMLMVAFYPLVSRSSRPGQRSRMFAKVTFVAAVGALAAIPVFSLGENLGYRTTTLAVAALAAGNVLATVLLRRDHLRHTAALPAFTP